MTKIFYDTEFLEDGKTLELISIGMVTEDDYQLYLINQDVDWDRVIKNEWLRTNVVSLLEFGRPKVWATKREIAYAVHHFIITTKDPELWAWYGAFDHIALAWLYGPMNQLPEGIPFWTNDLRQEFHRRGLNPEDYNNRVSAEHNAMADARDLKERYYKLFPRELNSDDS